MTSIILPLGCAIEQFIIIAFSNLFFENEKIKQIRIKCNFLRNLTFDKVFEKKKKIFFDSKLN